MATGRRPPPELTSASFAIAGRTVPLFAFYAATRAAGKLGRQTVTEQQHLTFTYRVDRCGLAV
jgi:hypothetical protein